MKIVVSCWQQGWQQIVQARCRPAAITQRRAPSQKKDAAAATIDIFVEEFLLEGSEIVGVDRADDDAGIAEQIFRAA